MPLTRSPTTSNVAASTNPLEETSGNEPLESLNLEPPVQNQGVQEYVVNMKRLEEMQVILLNQMSSLQSLVESSNLSSQNSITALRNDLRSVESNVSRFGIYMSGVTDTGSSNNPSNVISTVSSTITNLDINCSPSISTTPIMNPQATSYSGTAPNANYSYTSSNAAACVSTFTTSQPIAHTASSDLHPIRSSFVPKKIYPLPKFSGLPEEWLTFHESFVISTREFEYSELHNIMRLRDCLEGEARESVASLLTNARNVNAVICNLSDMYGRPEQLIKSQIHKVRSMSPVNDSDLNALMNFTNKVINMTTFLESVGGSYHLANPLLLSELLSKLPLSRRLQWAEKCLTMKSMPTIADFSEWLSDLRKIVNMASDSLPLSDDEGTRRYACLSVNNMKCRLCTGECKSLAACNVFSKLPIESRWQKVKSFRVCFSCLKFGHRANTCYSTKECKINGCDRYHHNLLHKDISPQSPNPEEDSKNSSVARSCLLGVNSQSVLFQIIPIRLYGPHGCEDIYAFIDDGANVSMVDTETAHRLGIFGREETLDIQWINQQVSRERSEIVDIDVSGVEQNSQKYNIKNVYLSSRLDLPSQSFNVSKFKGSLNQDIPLRSYNQVKPKMIISLAHAFLTVPIENPRMLSTLGPIATKTKLGWLVYGNVNDGQGRLISCHLRKTNETESNNELEVLMKSYFGIETFGMRHCEPVLSANDQRALDILNETTKRNGDRFESGMLWRSDFRSFPNSFGMALKRLDGREKNVCRFGIF